MRDSKIASLTATCKAMRNDTLPILYDSNFFSLSLPVEATVFEDIYNFHATGTWSWLRTTGPSILCHLRKVELGPAAWIPQLSDAPSPSKIWKGFEPFVRHFAGTKTEVYITLLVMWSPIPDGMAPNIVEHFKKLPTFDHSLAKCEVDRVIERAREGWIGRLPDNSGLDASAEKLHDLLELMRLSPAGENIPVIARRRKRHAVSHCILHSSSSELHGNFCKKHMSTSRVRSIDGFMRQ